MATPAVKPQHAEVESESGRTSRLTKPRTFAAEAQNNCRAASVLSSYSNFQAIQHENREDFTEDTAKWKTVDYSRRGGRWRSLKPPDQAFKISGKCSCKSRSKEFFCTSSSCRNDQNRNRPYVSVTTGRVDTDDGSPKSTTIPRRSETPLQPKPSIGQGTSASNVEALLNHLKGTLSSTSRSTSAEILDALRRASQAINNETKRDYWMTDAGQAELLRKYESTAKPPSSTGTGNGLCMFDYTQESKAMLSSAGASVEGEDDWIEVELTADTGACDTVIPRKMCPNIPIRPSLQSLRGMEYEVADGRPLPNLGERRCMMWTEEAEQPRTINMQVADVHKPLLSLSRCADMGFESRFGRTMGALIDEETGEVVPLRRKGNLYVLRCWLKAAPFGRPEGR